MHTDRIPAHIHVQALQDTSSPFCLFKDEDVFGSLSRILVQSDNAILFGVQGRFRGEVVGRIVLGIARFEVRATVVLPVSSQVGVR